MNFNKKLRCLILAECEASRLSIPIRHLFIPPNKSFDDLHYLDAVNANILLYLRRKKLSQDVLENAAAFVIFQFDRRIDPQR